MFASGAIEWSKKVEVAGTLGTTPATSLRGDRTKGNVR